MAQTPGARTVELPGGVFAAWSDASVGDLRPTGRGPNDAAALAGFADELARWTQRPIDSITWATQVHGAEVVTVGATTIGATTIGATTIGATTIETPGLGLARGDRVTVRHMGECDALVASTPRAAVCVLTADCGPLALSSPEGIFAAVHAGWRGLLDGVVDVAVERMRTLGATEIVAALGPCIHVGCYQFAAADVDRAARIYGDAVRGQTGDGHPALDVPAGIAAAVARSGARMVDGFDACTACSGTHFSHRARKDPGRQALIVWSVPLAVRA